MSGDAGTWSRSASPEDTAGYLCAAYLAATFEAWMQWAAGTAPDPVPYLLAAMTVLQIPDD